MDPISLALTFFLKNPALTTSTIDKALAPGSVDIAKMQESLVDLSKGVLGCYHKSARFGNVDFLGSPYNRQLQYGAEKSMVVRLRYSGIGGLNQYQMVVAILGKQDKVRAAVLTDSAVIPYNKKCELEDWVGG